MDVLQPTTPGKGLCFHWSAALVLDVDLPDVDLCIGILHEQLIHAWVEYGGNVYAPTLIPRMGDKLVPIPKDFYYAENLVREVKRLTHEQIEGIPNIKHHLTTGEALGPGRALGDELMAMAGIRWKTTPAGTAVAL
jgi:hypothetical protein